MGRKNDGLVLLLLFAASRRGSGAPVNKKTLDEIELLARAVGFPDPELAAAIALAESSGDASAIGDGGKSVGLWQINTAAHPEFQRSDLVDPTFNAQAALGISKRGTDWKPWSTYNSGSYKRFLRTPRP